MGFKGRTIMDAGYFYAPYIPLTSTPTMAQSYGTIHSSMESLHKQVERRAYELWNHDHTNSVACEDSGYYWSKAQDEIASPIARAIADEAGIIFKPGSIPRSHPYEFWRPENDYPYAYGYIEDDAFCIDARNPNDHPKNKPDPKNDLHRLFGVVQRYNLHSETDIQELIQYLKELLDYTYQMPEWPNSPEIMSATNPCQEIALKLDPASFKPNKGIITRYGKKLLDQGKKYYGKTTISNLANRKSE